MFPINEILKCNAHKKRVDSSNNKSVQDDVKLNPLFLKDSKQSKDIETDFNQNKGRTRFSRKFSKNTKSRKRKKKTHKLDLKPTDDESEEENENVKQHEILYNNMYGLFCFQNLLRRKIKFVREKKEFELLYPKKGKTKTKISDRQLRMLEYLRMLRCDKLKVILEQKTEGFMTGCFYDSIRKIFMGKILAVILCKYIQRYFGKNAQYKIVVHTSVIECIGQGVIVGSRCLIEKGVDKIISLNYKFWDAATVVNVYLISDAMFVPQS